MGWVPRRCRGWLRVQASTRQRGEQKRWAWRTGRYQSWHSWQRRFGRGLRIAAPILGPLPMRCQAFNFWGLVGCATLRWERFIDSMLLVRRSSRERSTLPAGAARHDAAGVWVPGWDRIRGSCAAMALVSYRDARQRACRCLHHDSAVTLRPNDGHVPHAGYGAASRANDYSLVP